MLKSASTWQGSAFPLGEEVVYFLVNMQPTHSTGEQLTVGAADQRRWFDCWNGVELKPAAGALSFDIDPTGFGCVVGTHNATSLEDAMPGPSEAELRSEAPPAPADLTSLLKTMATLTKRPIESFSPAFHYLNQTMLRADEKTTLRSPSSVAQGETYVHGGDFHFVASGVELEGSHDTGVDAQYPWETYPHRKHDHTMYVGAMIVDKHPVTNQQYSEYLEKSKYHPSDDGNWLKHSFEDGKIKAGWADKPVTYVSMADARAYCSFQKKRLPHACAFPHIPQPLSNPSLSLVVRSDGSVSQTSGSTLLATLMADYTRGATSGTNHACRSSRTTGQIRGPSLSAHIRAAPHLSACRTSSGLSGR